METTFSRENSEVEGPFLLPPDVFLVLLDWPVRTEPNLELSPQWELELSSQDPASLRLGDQACEAWC